MLGNQGQGADNEPRGPTTRLYESTLSCQTLLKARSLARPGFLRLAGGRLLPCRPAVQSARMVRMEA